MHKARLCSPKAKRSEKHLLFNALQLTRKGGDSPKAEALNPKLCSSYLEPNRNTLQKPIGGRFVFAIFSAKNMLKNDRSQPSRSSTYIGGRRLRAAKSLNITRSDRPQPRTTNRNQLRPNRNSTPTKHKKPCCTLTIDQA